MQCLTLWPGAATAWSAATSFHYVLPVGAPWPFWDMAAAPITGLVNQMLPPIAAAVVRRYAIIIFLSCP